jgi:glycosyltransferase involved in cell wall biosynthesis
MLISVIIPTYNRSHCIRRALESVAVQEVGDLEVIIGDDASTDDTVERVLEILPSARIARLEVNRGAAAARNAAMRMATGDYLAFLDSDDEWLPGKLTSQLEYLRSHPECAACGSGHFLETKNGLRIDFPGVNPPDWRRELHCAQSFHGASTPLVRRSVLESVGFQDEELRVLEDWDWMLRISMDHPIHVLPEMLTVIHENNPSDADQTLLSMKRFLAKHAEEFHLYGVSHARHVVSQHQENAARTLIRHGRLTEGGGMLLRSWFHAPLRNPAIPAAFPLLAVDLLTGSNLLADLMTRRNRQQLRLR